MLKLYQPKSLKASAKKIVETDVQDATCKSQEYTFTVSQSSRSTSSVSVNLSSSEKNISIWLQTPKINFTLPRSYFDMIKKGTLDVDSVKPLNLNYIADYRTDLEDSESESEEKEIKKANCSINITAYNTQQIQFIYIDSNVNKTTIIDYNIEGIENCVYIYDRLADVTEGRSGDSLTTQKKRSREDSSETGDYKSLKIGDSGRRRRRKTSKKYVNKVVLKKPKTVRKSFGKKSNNTVHQSKRKSVKKSKLLKKNHKKTTTLNSMRRR